MSGMFTYDDNENTYPAYEEVDIVWSRWRNTIRPVIDYSVQPSVDDTLSTKMYDVFDKHSSLSVASFKYTGKNLEYFKTTQSPKIHIN